MRTVTYKSVLHGAAIRAGGDPTEALLRSESRALSEYINSAVRLAYRRYTWPDTVLVKELTATGQAIPMAANGFMDVLGVYETNPDTDDNPPEVSYRKRGDNLYLPQDYETSTVFVECRPPVPVFTDTEWASATTYAADNLAYQPDDGLVYKAAQATTGDEPPDATYWSVVDFPEVIAEIVKEGARALNLSEEGQYGAGDAMLNLVERLIEEEIMVIEGQERLNNGYEVMVRPAR